MATQADIYERTLHYGVRAVRLCQHLQKSKDVAASVIGRQYLRAATSVGANLTEARSGESRKDFIHKRSIAQKEAREAIYWLRLLIESKLVSRARISGLLDETEQLIAVITAIILRTKRRAISKE